MKNKLGRSYDVLTGMLLGLLVSIIIRQAKEIYACLLLGIEASLDPEAELDPNALDLGAALSALADLGEELEERLLDLDLEELGQDLDDPSEDPPYLGNSNVLIEGQ